jgi:outer membrane protein OmpA-like peptidoglycan-associated protein
MEYMRRKQEARTLRRTASFAITLAAMAVLAFAAEISAQPATMSPVRYSSGQDGKVTGVITSRDGDQMVVRDETTRALSTVTITRETKVESPTGFLHLDRKTQSVTSLIPGLLVAVKGTGNSRGNLVADKISFRRSALRVAQQISGGEVELKSQQRATAAKLKATQDSLVAIKLRARDSLGAVTDEFRTALNTRMSELAAYDTRFTTTLNFAFASSALSPESRRQLDEVVTSSTGTQGFLIEVAAYTDTVGSADRNRQLSQDRADAVVAYLTQIHNIPLHRIVNPMGFGWMKPVASNATANGRAANRRAEVRVLVNRATRP